MALDPSFVGTVKVFVVMGNDYPDSAWATEAAAEAYCAKKKSEPRHGAHTTIHWRVYEFEVKS